MSDIPRLSAKERIILQMLVNAGGELYGLQMVRNSDGELKRGTVYVTLDRMEDKGFITSRPERVTEETRGIPRRLYRPTGLGERVLAGYELLEEHLAGGAA